MTNHSVKRQSFKSVFKNGTFSKKEKCNFGMATIEGLEKLPLV